MLEPMSRSSMIKSKQSKRINNNVELSSIPVLFRELNVCLLISEICVLRTFAMATSYCFDEE